MRWATHRSFEVGAVVTGTEIDDTDAGALHLVHEADVERGEAGLYGIVNGLVGHTELSGDRRHIDERATVSIEHPFQKPDDAIICPQQIGKTSSCSTCGLCWQSRKRIAFIQH